MQTMGAAAFFDTSFRTALSILGVAKTPWRAVVQGAGKCWRVEADALRETMATMPELRELVQGSLMVRLHQQSLATACQRFHSVSERLARWLLMSQDRAHADRFHVTQDFIAEMLGVRRAGVSGAASEFQRRGLIEYHRGELTVLDRLGLQHAACNCYVADKQLRDELMTSDSRRTTFSIAGLERFGELAQRPANANHGMAARLQILTGFCANIVIRTVHEFCIFHALMRD